MTNANVNPNQQQLQEQFASHIYEGYKSRAQEFNKTFIMLLAFALVFMLLIQVPYTLIKSQQVSMDKQLAELNNTVQHIDEKSKLYEQVQQGVSRLHQEMRSGPEMLRDKIQELSEFRNRLLQQAQSSLQLQQEQQQQQQQQQPSLLPSTPDCGDVRSEQWFSCSVEKAVNDQFAAFQKILREDIFRPLQALAKTGEPIDTQRIENGLQKLQEQFWNTLQNNRRFWVTFTGKEQFFSELETHVQEFWSTYAAVIEQKAATLKQELLELNKQRDRLGKEKIQLTKTADTIEARISSIESPFGKLPVGLAESIALYPLIIAFGFAIAAGRLNLAMQMRAEYARILRAKDPQKHVLSDEQIQLMAPLIYAPGVAGRASAPKLLILFVPLALFLLACGLIIYTWGPAIKEQELMTGLQPIYGALYLVTAIIMAVSYAKILKNLRQATCGSE